MAQAHAAADRVVGSALLGISKRAYVSQPA